MNSLRVRLILGFAVVALIPLGVAMFLLSRSVQKTVREQAGERLNATLGALQSDVRAEAARTLRKIGILSQDVTLRRLYLVQPAGSRDLSDYLAEKRDLLGLDFLEVADAGGAPIADAASVPAGITIARRGLSSPAALTRRVVLERVEGTPALAMAATAPIPYQDRSAGILRGGVLIDSTRLAALGRTSGVDLTLRDWDGRIAAAARVDPVPHRSAGRSFLQSTVALDAPAYPPATLTARISTAAADRTIADLRLAALALGLLGVVIAVVLGGVWSLQISRPVERLARFSERIARGDWEEPLTLRSVRELDTLVAALDRMRHDLRGYRERLKASERHQAWSLMARQVAHEVKNPLTPIAVSIADLKRSYERQREDFPEILDQAVRAIGEEIETLKRLLHEFSELGRFPDPVFARFAVADLFAEIRALYAHEVQTGRLELSAAPETAGDGDRAQLRQALVNLIQNALEATPTGGRVEVAACAAGDAIEISVRDPGPGLTAEQQANLFVPHFTTKPRGSGLGLTIVERIVNDHGGSIRVESEPGRGTTFRISLPRTREV
jgi:nitrogen fixation/metabolism regulation signal transduction histidine kinase